MRDLPYIESNQAGLHFFLAGCVIGATTGLGHFLATGSLNTIFGFTVLGGFLLSFCWMAVLVVRYNRRPVSHHRGLRHTPGLRSPWGVRRTETAGPFADRLAHFAAHSIEPKPIEDFAEQGPKGSHTTFWAIYDLPQDPTKTKPTWYLRRSLLRIKAAVRGSHF